MTANDFYNLPGSNIQLLAPLEALDFFDTQSVVLSTTITPLQAWGIVMSHPMPLLGAAFWVRDAISSLFGVEKIKGFSGQAPTTVKKGQRLDFFLVEEVSDDVLVLSSRDRHLDVLTCISASGTTVSITSSVMTHNRFGRFYMVPVAPAHKWIVRANLKQIRRYVVTDGASRLREPAEKRAHRDD